MMYRTGLSGVFSSGFLAASESESSPLPWWQVVTGLVAIPASLLGLALTWSLIKKTRLESAKIEQEIQAREERNSVAATDGRPSETAQLLAEPILESRRVQNLMVRFIILFVVATVWTLVRGTFDVVAAGSRVTLAVTFGDSLGNENAVTWAVIIGLRLLAAVPEVAYLLIVVGLGWPLLLDSLRAINVRSPEWIDSALTQRLLIVLAVLIPTSRALLPFLE